MNKSNGMTRRFNIIFDKKISSSILRHSYLSHKYDIDEMKKDSEWMGHSLDTQRTYMKSEK